MKTQIHTAAIAACLALSGTAMAATPGQTFFEQNCASCHTVDPALSSRAGPGLFNVLGRKAAGVPSFNYTDALTKAGAAGKTWTRAELDIFLRDPNKDVPGTAMPIGVADAKQRAAVIAYLATQSGKSSAPAAAAVTKTAAGDHAAWTVDKPGDLHHIKPTDLVAPFASESAGNGPKLAARPDGAMPAVPKGFKISIYADKLGKPRLPLRAPNGDIFLSDAAKGQITVLRANGEKAETAGVFAGGLSRPYGMALWPAGANPQYLYVANVNSVVRFPYSVGDLKAKGEPEVVVEKISDTSGGHVTRTLAFSKDGKTMLLSVGSATNIASKIGATPPQPLAQWEAKYGVGAAWGEETERAAVLAFDVDGRNRRPFANGLRNCVGMLVYPATGDLYCSVNERDELGDNLPPDYITRVKKDGFYGWPWYYIGANEEPRLKGIRPDLKNKVIVPDTLIQAHSAPLGMVVYQAPKGAKNAFPKEYEGDIFLALHGSWNRGIRTGYKVVRVLMKGGVPTGQYQDFMTGMVLSDRDVWGRPAAVEVAADGALLVVDDGGGVVWRIAPEK
ncbi:MULTISPECIES: PQQ-dependent sugar dehydrogenase [unclassified Massilia]|uniref:PQQ-dependent sugar dehydrogenase n=1 Tax=unclassified Massilia TaxID=2609279 RepID=UPI0017808010|nr:MULTISPECIES: PQQ-dependent sugar dehydrogenase [unclassified Massilia]MBD8532705.1 PQQ-dependent sugar dehydrogenase [Massilia sp. CFBP 13647]MBD8676066.1 PQQ-dependent sugar dehydrogenase [Massilia sp. CFBP 13721]